MGKKSGLSPKRRLFVAEYLKDRNATQAAIRAGYSAKDADVQGPRLLGFVGVKEAIENGLQALQKRTEVTADRVVREIARLAFSDMGMLLNDDGTLVPAKKLPKNIRRCISSIEVDEIFSGTGDDKVKIGETKKVKLWDKVKALELLCKKLGLLIDRHRHEVGEGFQLIVHPPVVAPT